MAKPTKSLEGVPAFQFMASKTIPSPRCSLRVKSAAGLVPAIWNPVLILPVYCRLRLRRNLIEATCRKCSDIVSLSILLVVVFVLVPRKQAENRGRGRERARVAKVTTD